MSGYVGDELEAHRHVARDEINSDLRAGAIGHVQHARAGHHVEIGGRQMLRAALFPPTNSSKPWRQAAASRKR